MSVFYVLVPLALALAGAGVLAFRWAVRDGQFDDVETPALRILLDDEPAPPPAIASPAPDSPAPDSPAPDSPAPESSDVAPPRHVPSVHEPDA